MEKSRQIKKKRRTQHYLATCGTFSVKTSAVLMYHSKDGITRYLIIKNHMQFLFSIIFLPLPRYLVHA